MYKNFLKLLEKTGETAADVSRATGIAQSTLTNWKQRDSNLSLKNASKIAKHFEVPIEFFLEE